MLFFKILRFTFFAVSWSIFGLYRPILPFWNYQSLIYNISLLGKYAMNSMTEIEEIMCLLFFKQTLWCRGFQRAALQFCTKLLQSLALS